MSSNPFEITYSDLEANADLYAILSIFRDVAGAGGEELRGIYKNPYFLIIAMAEGAIRWNTDIASGTHMHRDMPRVIPEKHAVLASSVAAVKGKSGIAVEGWLAGASARVMQTAGYRAPLIIETPQIMVASVSEEFTLQNIGWHVIDMTNEFTPLVEVPEMPALVSAA